MSLITSQTMKVERHPIQPGSPIDGEHLARYTFGNVSLEREVLCLFSAQAPDYLSVLQRSRTSKEWRDAAHTLKGSARAVGAHRVSAAAERVEKLHDSTNKLDRLAALAELAEALDEVCGFISSTIGPSQ
jgi:HPt (histidine-containing phosphotransfer) domain-containing protein